MCATGKKHTYCTYLLQAGNQRQCYSPVDPTVQLLIIRSAHTTRSLKVKYWTLFLPVSKRLLAKNTIAQYFLKKKGEKKNKHIIIQLNLKVVHFQVIY